MIEGLQAHDLYSPLAINFAVRQWVVINKLVGFMPLQHGNLQIVRLSYSSVVVELHYEKGGKTYIEKDIHIPYEHLMT